MLPNWELDTMGVFARVRPSFKPVNNRDVYATREQAEYLYRMWRAAWLNNWTDATFERHPWAVV